MSAGQRRALIILVVALFVVTGLLMLPERREGSEEGLRPLYPDVVADNVVKLEVQRVAWDGPARLERTDVGWVMQSPVEAPADAGVVGSLLRSLVGLEIREAITTSDLVPYGLEEGASIELTFETEAGARHELRIGSATVGTGTYLLVGGEVVPARGLIAQGVPETPVGLRDRRAWGRALDDVVRISVYSAGVDEPWAAARSPDGAWTWPDGGPIEGPTVADPAALLRFLDSLRVKRFREDWDGIDLWSYDVQLVDASGKVLSTKLHDGGLAVAPCCRSPVELEAGVMDTVRRFTGLEE